MALVGWRLELLLVRAFAMAEKLVDLKEKELLRPGPQKAEEIPLDLFLGAQMESEPWAREAAKKAVVELYQDLGSWDAVRSALAVRSSSGASET